MTTVLSLLVILIVVLLGVAAFFLIAWQQEKRKSAERTLSPEEYVVIEEHLQASPPQQPQPDTATGKNGSQPKKKWIVPPIAFTIAFCVLSFVPALYFFYVFFLWSDDKKEGASTEAGLGVGVYVSGLILLVLLGVLFFWLIPRIFSSVPRVWGFTNTSAKLRVLFWIVSTMVVTHILLFVFFGEVWGLWRGHAILFWGVNVGVLVVAFLAFAGFSYGRMLAWVLGILVLLGAWSHFAETHTWKKWKSTMPSISQASSTKVAKVDLPSGVLKCEPTPEIQKITGWPEMYELEVRNIDMQNGTVINFDLWKDGIGKYGEYRWDKEVSPRSGRFTRCDKPVTGKWRLTEDLGPTPRYSRVMKGWHKADGALHEEPMTLFVRR